MIFVSEDHRPPTSLAKTMSLVRPRHRPAQGTSSSSAFLRFWVLRLVVCANLGSPITPQSVDQCRICRKLGASKQGTVPDFQTAAINTWEPATNRGSWTMTLVETLARWQFQSRSTNLVNRSTMVAPRSVYCPRWKWKVDY